MNNPVSVILSEHRNADPKQAELQAQLTAALMARDDVELTVVPHLYDLEADGPATDFLRSIEGDMIVLAWLYTRGAYWTLRAKGVGGDFRDPRGDGDPGSQAEEVETSGSAPADRAIWCLDLREGSGPDDFLGVIDRIAAGATGRTRAPRTKPSEPFRPQPQAAFRWYPVIDFQRCTDCLECLNFCLFGVYGLDRAESILIEQPDACRTGCPACSRICPEGAIIFPQHKDPAIAGDPRASVAALKLDLSQLFGGFQPAETATAERDRALAEAPPESPPEGKQADPLDQLVDGVDELDL